MSVFDLHSNVLRDYQDYVRSFFTIADDRAFVDQVLTDEARLWPGLSIARRPILVLANKLYKQRGPSLLEMLTPWVVLSR